MLPSSAGVRFQKGGEAHVMENVIPIQRVNQVAHGLIGSAFGMFLVRQDHGRRNGHTQFVRQGIIEKLVIGSPPERVIDDYCSAEHSILQIGAIEGDVLRNAVYDDPIAARICHLNPTHLDELCRHAFKVHVIDPLDQGGRKRVFHSEDDADFLCARAHKALIEPCNRGRNSGKIF